MKSQILDNTAVIKIGTDVITTPTGLLDRRRIGQLVDQFMKIRQRFDRLLIVTSGAMGAGRAAYHRTKQPDETVAEKQKYSAVGQVPLMDAYNYFIQKEGLLCSQHLLTRLDFTSRKNYENTRRAFREILEDSVPTIPIINENDTVATEELMFGDNDKLAGYVTRMMRARLLILLTTKKGLLADVDRPESLISHVDPLTDDWGRHIRHGEMSPNGTGGMPGKCCAASKVARRGSYAVIADCKEDGVLQRMILAGERKGTLFSRDGEEESWAKIHRVQHSGMGN